MDICGICEVLGDHLSDSQHNMLCNLGGFVCFDWGHELDVSIYYTSVENVLLLITQ